MTMNQIEDLTDYLSLSLSGVVLAAELVHASACGLPQDRRSLQAVKQAITSQHATALREVFPDTVAYEAGVASAIGAIKGQPDNPEALRYTLQLIEIATLLGKSPQALERLGKGLDGLPQDPTDAEFAAVYQSSISTLGKRIQVTGNPQLLQQPRVAEEIRALLLGGVRFAWLWQQLGGRRWHLVLRRKSILGALQALHTILRSSSIIH